MSGKDSRTGTERWLNVGPEVKSIEGRSGIRYLVFRTRDGNFHAYQPVDIKKVALDCGATEEETWTTFWESHEPLRRRSSREHTHIAA